jgi:hypothetical protein
MRGRDDGVDALDGNYRASPSNLLMYLITLDILSEGRCGAAAPQTAPSACC